MKSEKISFWNFLKENKIVIPIIQRDYAQGRKDQQFIRTSFLASLKKVLDSEKNEKLNLNLDFVYGNIENGSMNLLDGQQRMTTLWLLHWYLAYKTKKLDEEEIKKILKKFSYETRTSSGAFCKSLCELKDTKKSNVVESGTANAHAADKPEDTKKSGVVEYIQNQTWFYSSWKQDPTINSMLRMLKGEEGFDSDGIEKVFGSVKEDDLEKYWEKLTNNTEDCPITFYKMEIGTEKLPLSDDLYIKMNARGKPLTDFENFKADFIDWMRENEKDKCVELASKIDNDWTDIFWKNKKDGKIDDIYFAFINRYFLNEYLIHGKDGKGQLSQESFEKQNNEVFNYFYKQCEQENSERKYNGFENYKVVLDANSKLVSEFETVLDNIKLIQGDGDINKKIIDLSPEWIKKENDKNDNDSSFTFLPKYKEKKEFTQKQRVVFYAVCKFLESNKYEDEEKNKEYWERKLKRWLRVVWNIAENSNENSSISGFVGLIRLIDKICPLDKDIYENLREYAKKNKDELNKENIQLQEEIAKAEQILAKREDSNNVGPDEDDIKKAEKDAFFKGAIRFLFSNENGFSVEKPDWSNFETKRGNAKEYFDENGVAGDYKVKLIFSLIKQIENHDELYNEQLFDSSADTWKSKILCSNDFKKEVHHMLNPKNDLKDIEEVKATDSNEGDDIILEEIKQECLISNLVEEHSNFRLHWYGNCWAFYAPFSTSDAILVDWGKVGISARNSILRELISKNDITINNSTIENKFWKGFIVKFNYKDSYFEWNGYDNYIYLTDSSYNRLTKSNSENNYDKFFRFDAKDITPGDFCKKLDELIK